MDSSLVLQSITHHQWTMAWSCSQSRTTNGQWPGLAVNHAPPMDNGLVLQSITHHHPVPKSSMPIVRPFTSLPGKTMYQLPGAVKPEQVYFKFCPRQYLLPQGRVGVSCFTFGRPWFILVPNTSCPD
jgi:hypothetical protein